ncbi:hypothetical protein MKEN_01384100 [Mycena kentingensis (nom. inval.)]|nr:hypothetical protein MKEN_01384100 [Mycena kentingensis (nom. inval.)]
MQLTKVLFLATWAAIASAAALESRQDSDEVCRVCIQIFPECPPCEKGRVCKRTPQTCKACASATCVPAPPTHCVFCPKIFPTCLGGCPKGETCVVTPATCTTCAFASCVPDSYTI